MSKRNKKKISDIENFKETGDNNQLNQNINNMNKRDQRINTTQNKLF